MKKRSRGNDSRLVGSRQLAKSLLLAVTYHSHLRHLYSRIETLMTESKQPKISGEVTRAKIKLGVACIRTVKYNRLAPWSKQRYLGIIFLGEKQLHVGLTPGSIGGYKLHTVYYTDRPHSILIVQRKLKFSPTYYRGGTYHYKCFPKLKDLYSILNPNNYGKFIGSSTEVDTNGCLRAHKQSLLLISYVFAQYYWVNRRISNLTFMSIPFPFTLFGENDSSESGHWSICTLGFFKKYVSKM